MFGSTQAPRRTFGRTSEARDVGTSGAPETLSRAAETLRRHTLLTAVACSRNITEQRRRLHELRRTSCVSHHFCASGEVRWHQQHLAHLLRLSRSTSCQLEYTTQAVSFRARGCSHRCLRQLRKLHQHLSSRKLRLCPQPMRHQHPRLRSSRLCQLGNAAPALVVSSSRLRQGTSRLSQLGHAATAPVIDYTAPVSAVYAAPTLSLSSSRPRQVKTQHQHLLGISWRLRGTPHMHLSVEVACASLVRSTSICR